MLNFDFYNPTHIVFGSERIEELGSLIPEAARVLVIYGGGSAKKTGTLDEVKQALSNEFIMEFGGVEANPTYETLMKAVEVVKENKIDFLLAVGGGSVVDGAKFVAAAAKFEGHAWDILLERGDNITSALDFGVVLTLPATGSEMNCGSVITRLKDKSKLAFMNRLVYPKFSILDPTKTYTLPKRQVANGLVDAFVHIVEQYLTYPVNSPVQDRFSEGLLLTLTEIGPQVIKQENDYETMANFSWVATMALNGLIGVGVPQDWSTHMIGHELTALYGIDHARSLAIILPSLLKERKTQKREKLLQFSKRVWSIELEDEDAVIDLAIDKTRDFFESLGVKTRLSDYELGQGSVKEVLAKLEEHNMIALGEHEDIDLEVSQRILTASL